VPYSTWELAGADVCQDTLALVIVVPPTARLEIDSSVGFPEVLFPLTTPAHPLNSKLPVTIRVAARPSRRRALCSAVGKRPLVVFIFLVPRVFSVSAPKPRLITR